MLDLNVLNAEFSRIVQSADGNDAVASELAKAYNDYAKGAVIKGSDCSAGGSLDLLESAFTSDNTPATMLNMAAKLCIFWQDLPKPGIPSHGGITVVSVIPSFQPLNSALYLAITSCVTTSLIEEPYKRLFEVIENVLKTAPILIIEAMPTTPPSTLSFTEYLQ